jgi:hypothetical protein
MQLGRLLGICAVTTVSSTSLMLFASSVSAVGSRSFDALAAADGARVQVVSPGAPLTDQVVDAGGPTAQARLSSVGTSTGFAAYPDPGATVLGAPSTAGTSAVGYPLIASSSYPVTPSSSVAPGPYALTATSHADGSDASASSGAADPSAALLSSQAHVALTGGSVTARSESDDRSLGTGPVSVARVHATATVTQPAEGDARSSSTFEVSGLTVAGTSVGIGPEGLTVAGTTTPLPDTSPVTAALAAAHVSISYLAPARTKTSAVSAGLRIAVGDPAGQHTVYVLGQASARISQVVTDDFLPPPVDIGGPPGSAPPAGGGGQGSTTGPLTSGPLPPGVVQPQVGTPPASPPPSVAGTRLVHDVTVLGWPRSFFLVLGVGGLLAVLVASLFSYLGVRNP